MVRLIDTTLREGEQAPGVSFNLDAKKNITSTLVELGINEIELGMASPQNHDLVPLSRHMHTVHPKQEFSLWSRCNEEDIRFAASLKPDCLALSIPASDLHLHKKLGKNRSWAVKQLHKSITQAKAAGCKVAVGLEDATRADHDFIKTLAYTAKKAGAFRLRLADTVGISTPVSLLALLENLKDIDLEVGVHCHNDFGMATANTITAIEHGVAWADVTVLGLGERAGNSRLEEVLGFLVLQKKEKHFSLSGLRRLSEYVAKEAKRSINPSRPIIGKDLFRCETGLHLHGLMKDPATYEPFDPSLVGMNRTLLIGCKAGKRCIAATLKRLGLPRQDDLTLSRLTSRIRTLASELKRPLTDHEITCLADVI